MALAAADGVDFAGAGLVALMTCQTSLLPLLTHLKDADFVFATAPSLAQAPPAFAAEFDAEKAMGTERIPSATTELAMSSEIFFGDLVMGKRYPLLSASTSKVRYLYCYEKW